MMSISGVGMNEGHFTLIIPTSSYVNPKWVDWVGLWVKCNCFLSKVIPISNQLQGGIVGQFGGIWVLVEGCCASQGWMLWEHDVLTCNMSSVWFSGCLRDIIWYIYPNGIKKTLTLSNVNSIYDISKMWKSHFRYPNDLQKGTDTSPILVVVSHSSKVDRH